MKFHKLFTPLKIGDMEIRNRIVHPAIHLNAAADGGFVTEQIIEYYRRMAKGGAGLIIVGGCPVSTRGQGVPMMISMFDDKFIPKLQDLTNAVKSEGAKICAQLYHAGAYAYSKLIKQDAVSSSAIPSKFTHETPRALETDEVGDVIDNFVSAAKRVVQARFNAVELISSAGYLLDQFLSPLKNKRTDKYGGDTLEERLTFPLELISRVIDAVGKEINVGIRISGDDFVPGSNSYKEKLQVAKAYAKAGVDYINVTGGWHETRVPQIPMTVPVASYAFLAQEIKNAIEEQNQGIPPVFASNRINDPIVAENLIQDFYCDAVCMGRALLADPDLPKKRHKNC